MHTPIHAIAITLFASAAAAMPQAHPHFNDGGTLTWYASLTKAKAAARQEAKLIFIEYGRER